MISDAQRPRLLLAATLLCTFSVLGAIGYHAAPGAARAAGPSLPGLASEARESRAARGGPEAAAPLDPAEEAGPGFTLNPHGAGLVPTEAPGSFERAGSAAAAEAAAAGSSSDDARAQDAPAAHGIPFSMPGPRRPASAGSRNE